MGFAHLCRTPLALRHISPLCCPSQKMSSIGKRVKWTCLREPTSEEIVEIDEHVDHDIDILSNFRSKLGDELRPSWSAGVSKMTSKL